MYEDSDQALATRAMLSDRAAFETLIRRTGRLVFAHLYLKTGNPHEAEDLTQETFLTAYRKIRQLENPAAFRPWIFSIANSIHLDSQKKKSRKKRGKPRNDFAIDQMTDGSPTPSECMEQNERREKVLIALRSLPTDYQQPLSLKYLAGADYETISRQLGLTNGSLRGLLHRGLEMLRDRMNP